MKKTILSIAVIAAAFVAASCAKENLQENIASEGSASVFTAAIEAQAGTKTTVEKVTSPSVAYKTKWESTDQISINGDTFTATPDGTDATKATFSGASIAPLSDYYYALYPASIFGAGPGLNFQLPATYTYADGKYNMPMYAQSTTKYLSFKNLCGVLAITVSNVDFATVSSIEVSSDKQMNGAFTATAEGALTFTDKTLEDADKKVTLTFTSAKTIAVGGSATFYIPVPANTHNPLTIKVSDGTTTKTKTTTKSGGVKVERNTVYPIVFNYPPGTLPGEFSISNDGGTTIKKIHFSKGNLYCSRPSSESTDWTWHFYDEQYQYNSLSTSQSRTAADTEIDLFTWGYSEATSLLPIEKTYVTDHTTTEDNQLNPSTGGDDWGVAYCNSNSIAAGTWRTLTIAEWQYLFNTSSRMVNGKPCYSYAAGVSIGGTNYKGVFIYPDNYNGDVVSSSMTKDQINAAGIVFLPAAGSRIGSTVYDAGSWGRYWSSTANGSETHAFRVGFNNINVALGSDIPRGHGSSVRLITDSKICQSPSPGFGDYGDGGNI